MAAAVDWWRRRVWISNTSRLVEEESLDY